MRAGRQATCVQPLGRPGCVAWALLALPLRQRQALLTRGIIVFSCMRCGRACGLKWVLLGSQHRPLQKGSNCGWGLSGRRRPPGTARRNAPLARRPQLLWPAPRLPALAPYLREGTPGPPQAPACAAEEPWVGSPDAGHTPRARPASLPRRGGWRTTAGMLHFAGRSSEAGGAAAAAPEAPAQLAAAFDAEGEGASLRPSNLGAQRKASSRGRSSAPAAAHTCDGGWWEGAAEGGAHAATAHAASSSGSSAQRGPGGAAGKRADAEAAAAGPAQRDGAPRAAGVNGARLWTAAQSQPSWVLRPTRSPAAVWRAEPPPASAALGTRAPGAAQEGAAPAAEPTGADAAAPGAAFPAQPPSATPDVASRAPAQTGRGAAHGAAEHGSVTGQEAPGEALAEALQGSHAAPAAAAAALQSGDAELLSAASPAGAPAAHPRGAHAQPAAAEPLAPVGHQAEPHQAAPAASVPAPVAEVPSPERAAGDSPDDPAAQLAELHRAALVARTEAACADAAAAAAALSGAAPRHMCAEAGGVARAAGRRARLASDAFRAVRCSGAAAAGAPAGPRRPRRVLDLSL